MQLPSHPTELQALRQDLLARYQSWQQAPDWHEKPAQVGIRSGILHPADGSIPLVRAERELACPAATLFAYLVTDIDQTCREWNDLMIYSRKIRDLGEGAELSRIISEGQLLADREDVFIRFSFRQEDGTLLELSQGVGTEIEPVYTGISRYTQRSLMHLATKEITPLGSGRCRYRTLWHYDPAGWLSRLLPRRFLGDMIRRNLVHEHRKLGEIFGPG